MADRTVTYRLQADIAQFRAQMAQASAAVKQTATEMTALDKRGATMRTGLSTLGSTAGKVGLVAAAGLGAAVLASAKFDSAMSGVAAATHESTQNMELLRVAALKAGADTVFSATEAAGAIEALAKAGVSTSDILGGGLQGALDLAAAGSMDVAAAAEAAATAMTQFGLQGQDVPHVADLLAAAAGKAQGEVSDFSMALNQSGLVAAQMGLSIEETTGSLAAFASAGLVGSDAGTSLKTMLLRLANPSKEAASAMKEFGISAYDAQGNLLPMADIAEQIKTGFEGQSQATRDAALATIFGSDAIRAANVLYNEGAQGIDDWTNAVNDQGYAAETAATKLDNLKGDWEAFTGSLETALIGVGDKQQGFFRSIVQGATDVTNAFNKLPDAAKGVTGAFLGITAITGGSLWLGAKVITGISETRQALEQLGPAGTKAAAGLKGVVGAAAGLMALNAASDAVNAMFRSLDAAAPSVERLTRNLENLGQGKSKYTALSIRAISEEVGSLSDLLDTTDSRFAGTLKQTTDWLGKIPLVGDTAANQIENLDAVTTHSLQGWREADATILALDESLMQLAGSAGPGGAEKAFNQLARSQGLSADQQAKLMALLPEFGDLMRDTGRAGEEAGDGTSFFGESVGRVLGIFGPVTSAAGKTGDALKGVGDKARDGADGVNTMKAALEELMGFLDRRAAVRNYEQALDDLGQSIKDNGKTFDINTEKGRKNQQALDDIASSAAQVASHMKGLNKQRFMEQAAADIRQRARELGIPADAIQVIINKLIEASKTKARPKVEPEGIPETKRELDDVKKQMGVTNALKAKPSVDVNGSPAFAAIEGIKSALRNIPDEQVYVHVNRIGGVTSSYGGRSDDSAADGSTVPKTGLPYADRHPYLLADGEEVISNRYGQADRHRQLLKAINAGRLADGGTVSLSTYARTRGAGTFHSSAEFDAAYQAMQDFTYAMSGAIRSTETYANKQKMNQALLRDEEKELRLMNKAYEDHREALQAEVADLKELKQARAGLKESVASNFMGEGFQADPSIGFSAWDALELTLKNQAAQATAFGNQLKAAQQLGLSGGLFQYVAQSGDYGLAAEFADMTKQQIRQAERLFQQRNQAAAAVGSFAGDTIYGRDIREQTHEIRGLRHDSRDMRDSIKRQEAIIKRQEKTIARLEKTGPERTGREVRKAVDSTAAAGRRRRNP